MDRHAITTDALRVHYEVSGTGTTALVFVHGWLGNTAWWSAQRDHLATRYSVVLIELPGHGRSDKTRTTWSAAQYANDIKAVCHELSAQDIMLIGHSMSGAYVCEAAPQIAKTRAVILVDTMKTLDQILPAEQVAQILDMYRKD